MRRYVTPMCIVLAVGCRRQEPANTKSATMPAMPGMAQMRAGSAAFHLEIGGVYERFQDHKSALDHLSQAARLAEDSVQRVQAYSALARVKEAAGDRDGAIDALERARAEIDKLKTPEPSGGPAPAGPFAGPGVDDVLVRLARLYAEAGRYEQGDALCERGLSAAREPWQREQFHRLQVELHRKAGTLDKKIAEIEKALDQTPRDESALRFLAVALSGDGMPGPAAMGAPPGQPQADSSKLVRVYERLHELRQDDLQVRQNLQSLLERAGRIDEAVKLATATHATTPMECSGPVASQPASSALQAAAEAIRIRARAGQTDKALAEAAKLAALAKREGIAAYLVAAELHLEQGAADRATQLIGQAAREARSREDQRQVAFARERASTRAARADELKSMYEQWKRSDDPCLRLSATQREAQLAMMGAGPAMAPPPAHRP